MCIMDYDTLQFCDFLGSVCSIWVTLLCMARVRDTLKYVRHRFGLHNFYSYRITTVKLKRIPFYYVEFV